MPVTGCNLNKLDAVRVSHSLVQFHCMAKQLDTTVNGKCCTPGSRPFLFFYLGVKSLCLHANGIFAEFKQLLSKFLGVSTSFSQYNPCSIGMAFGPQRLISTHEILVILNLRRTSVISVSSNSQLTAFTNLHFGSFRLLSGQCVGKLSLCLYYTCAGECCLFKLIFFPSIGNLQLQLLARAVLPMQNFVLVVALTVKYLLTWALMFRFLYRHLPVFLK